MSTGNRNIFDFLDLVRVRPKMLLTDGSLHDLESMVYGYYAAHHDRSVPNMNIHFADWLEHRTGWSLCRGWADAIDVHEPTAEKRYARFFSFVDEFRKLKPVRICTVKLAAWHNPTGKRVTIGFTGRIKKPSRVDVIQYCPEPFYFLRFHFGRRSMDNHLLTRGNGSCSTSLRFAKQWVKDELQVKFKEWQT